jgi:hypothetical protein
MNRQTAKGTVLFIPPRTKVKRANQEWEEEGQGMNQWLKEIWSNINFPLLQTMYISRVMERFRLSGRGEDPVKTCCGRGKNVVNTAWTY